VALSESKVVYRDLTDRRGDAEIPILTAASSAADMCVTEAKDETIRVVTTTISSPLIEHSTM
jgi:hypothetical protein